MLLRMLASTLRCPLRQSHAIMYQLTLQDKAKRPSGHVAARAPTNAEQENGVFFAFLAAAASACSQEKQAKALWFLMPLFELNLNFCLVI